MGEPPIPPYIARTPEDPRDYQTVYARTAGAVAAPTAGLHFTEALLAGIRARGTAIAFLTVLLVRSKPAAAPVETPPPAVAAPAPGTPFGGIGDLMRDMQRRMRDFGSYVGRMFSPYDFSEVRLTGPTETFEGRRSLTVGDGTHGYIVVPVGSRHDALIRARARAARVRVG